MKHCILHVGMHKTGTSSIQRSLDGFASDSFVYGNLGGHPNHSRAVFALVGVKPGERGAGSARARKQAGGDPLALSRLEHSIAEARGRTWLLSGEGIALLPREALQRLRQILSMHFDHLTVVAAVRAPAGYMASAFQEPVKQGTKGALQVSARYRSYRRTFGKFHEVFGKENVELWKFDPSSFPGGCAVRDFCRRLGIELPERSIVRANESLSREAMGLLFSYRKLGGDLGSMSLSGAENARLVQHLSKVGTTRFRFSPSVTTRVLQEQREDIEWMEGILGQSLHEELGEPEPGDVRGELDLLTPDPRAVAELRAALGARAPAGVEGRSPREVALLVHALRGEGLPRSPTLDASPRAREVPRDARATNHGGSRMTVKELVDQLHAKDPTLLGIPRDRAEALVRHIFRQLNETLAATEDGVVKYAGLGQFLVRKVVREVDGKQVTRSRIVFRRAGSGHEAD